MDTRSLAVVPLFEGLSRAHLESIGALVTERRLLSGEVIFREGDSGDALYVLLQGNVRISKRIRGVGEEALAILEPGSCFGEMALIDSFPRSADAIAHTDCVLGVIQKADMEQLLRLDQGLACELLWRFVRTLSARLRETNEKIKVFFTLSTGF
jgi:CRP/FNR family cyclic AMP-dependent transcriptional regulator